MNALNKKDGWVEIGPVREIPPLGARIIHREAGDIAIFRTGDERIFALDNKCPHKGGPLADGIVHGCRVTCPLHGRVFDLETGEAVAPDKGKAAIWPVRVEDGIVFLQIRG